MKKAVSVLAILSIIAMILFLVTYSPEHPILLKYVTFSARSLGCPIQASVYTDGQLDRQVKVFSTSKYLLLYWDNHHVINVHADYVGTPVGIGSQDYDFFGGRLFQSEVGGTFVPFHNNIKRSYHFDSQLAHTPNETNFKIAPEEKTFTFRSVKIILANKGERPF